MFITDSAVWFEMADSFCDATMEINNALYFSLRTGMNVQEIMQWCHDTDMAFIGM